MCILLSISQCVYFILLQDDQVDIFSLLPRIYNFLAVVEFYSCFAVVQFYTFLAVVAGVLLTIIYIYIYRIYLIKIISIDVCAIYILYICFFIRHWCISTSLSTLRVDLRWQFFSLTAWLWCPINNKVYYTTYFTFW